MIKIILFLCVAMVALQNTSNAQIIQNTVWKSFFAAPINDTATLTIGNDSITISNSHGITMVKSTVRINADTITIKDVDGPIKCSSDENGVYHYTLSADKLVLHLISDLCDGRANSISDREWMKENGQ
jgi:hypothetical protein